MRLTRLRWLAAAAVVLVALLGATAQAQPAWRIDWWTADGGGGPASLGGGLSLGGTIGQADAAPGGLPLAGGGFALQGGFWGGAAPRHRLFVPLVGR